MDAFFAAVEQRDHPQWRGKPVVVGGPPKSRGVVSTCSYEARQYGIHSAMSSYEAYKRCPQAIFVTEANFPEYHRVSQQVHSIFHEITDVVEPLSIDEAFLDVSENKLGECSATRLAQRIQQRIFEETQLTASAGVSYNKSLAKIASDWKKPHGLTVIPPQTAQDFLKDLPVTKFWGVGPVTAKRMEKLGIQTAGELRSWPLWRLIDVFGKSGPWFYSLCRGIDERPVCSLRQRKSLGKERTFPTDLMDVQQIATFLDGVCQDVWEEVTEKKLQARRVTVKVKYNDFRLATRSRSFPTPLKNLHQFQTISRELLQETKAGERPVRLAGTALSLFPGEEGECAQLELPFPLI